MANGEKVQAYRWRGLLASSRRSLRMIALATLACLCVALTFTQLGFLHITLSNESSVYAVLLLLPVSLAALSLGVLDGALIGLLAGALLYVHARTMPLDIYEMVYVNGYNSVVFLAFAGLAFGLAFALALRGNPSNAKRVVRIVIICLVFSWLYSGGFAISAFVTTVSNFAESGIIDHVSNNEAAEALAAQIGTLDDRYGRVDIQAWIDGGLTALVCVCADFAPRALISRRENMGMSEVFNGALLIVVVNVFFLVSAATFVAISSHELSDAYEEMKDSVRYLHDQVDSNDAKIASLNKFFEEVGVDPNDVDLKTYQYYSEAISMLGLMDGYSLDTDGIVFCTSGSLILMTNAPGVTERLTYSIDEETLTALTESVESGQVKRFIFDGTLEAEDENGVSSSGRPELAYVYGETSDSGFVEGIIKPASLVYADRMSVMLSTAFSTLMLLLAVSGAVFFMLNRMVLRRIDETNGVLARITAGDLDARVEARDSREFESLSDGINTTVDAMKDLIAEAETRMDAELATARAIQESALPRTFPAFPDILRFDVFASMNPAKEVGGDFYDFFLIGDDAGPDAGKLGFVVADVSGKGVPAALFMMEAKTQIRSYVSSGMELGEAIENANRQLCDGNDAGMFVTAWVGVLDYATGHVDYVNAGHNPPLLWAFDDGGQGAGWRWLTERSGLPLGLFDGLPYTAHSVDCLPGDQFLLYSDGVTEAMSTGEELYGEARLEELASGCVGEHPRQLVEAVRADVARHAQGAEQSDDITILSLEVGVPPEVTVGITVPAHVSQLSVVNDFIHAELDRRLCPKRVQNLLDVAVEELFVNVCRYAYPDATMEVPGTIRVSCAYSAEPQSMTILLADDGVPFDPLAKPDAVTPEDIFDVPIGGLGILMAKRSVDEMSYERSGNSNVVSIMKKW